MRSAAYRGRNLGPDGKLVHLIWHFNKHKLTNDNFVFPDLLSAAYEYMIKYFVDSAGKKDDKFYTPSTFIQLMARIIKPQENMEFYDIKLHILIQHQGIIKKYAFTV